MWDAQIDDPFGSALRFAPLVVLSGEESLETGPIFCCVVRRLQALRSSTKRPV